MSKKKNKQKKAPTKQTKLSNAQQEQAASQTEAVIEPSVELTPEQVEAEIDEIAATPKRERIWEVDFVRGLMILFVVWDHFMWDVNDMGMSSAYNTGLFRWLFNLSETYYSGSLRNVTQPFFVTMFVLTSGVSCSFSRNNGKRALKMCAFAILFSAATYAISAILHVELTIYFNVIHVIALSVLLYTAIEWIWGKLTKNWQKNIFGVLFFAVTMTAIIVGSCANYMSSHWTDILFGQSAWRSDVIYKFEHGGDYLSFLPDFGWFLVGVVLGKAIYREKKSIFPSVNPKYVSPVTFCGRFSIWVYFGSQVVMYGFIYLLHELVNIL